MNKQNTDKLFKDFPNLYASKDLPDSRSRMIDGFCCRDGWFKLIYDMSRQLEPLIVKFIQENPDKDPPVAFQVKEKFGTLSFYMDGYTDEIRDIISAATNKSASTCEECGRYGKLRSGGWVRCLCEQHANGRPAWRPYVAPQDSEEV